MQNNAVTQYCSQRLSLLRRARAQPFSQFRPPPPPRDIAHRDGNGLLLSNQHHEPLPSGDSGVEEIALQHSVMLGEHWDDHGGIFRPLALVNGRRIGRHQYIESPNRYVTDRLSKVTASPPHRSRHYRWCRCRRCRPLSQSHSQSALLYRRGKVQPNRSPLRSPARSSSPSRLSRALRMAV
jgi:hypothetical protein